MSSREKILEAVLKNQPALTALPDISIFKSGDHDAMQEYADIFTSIGGKAFIVEGIASIVPLIQEHFDVTKRMVTTLPEFKDHLELYAATADPHSFEDVELALIRAHFAVAENGTVWLTEQVMGQRILPFICQHLAVIVDANTIVHTMHDAYKKIGEGQYGFGVFIGGPSKTADIEQSLVMGAHGPITMTVFIVRGAAIKEQFDI